MINIQEQLTNTKIKTISIIRNHENTQVANIYTDDLLFINNLGTTDNISEVINLIKENHDDVLILDYIDNELPVAWENSFKKDNTLNWDVVSTNRRLRFHSYDITCEEFAIDYVTYHQITGGITEVPLWKQGIIQWYKEHLILGGE